jgi:hypothetical protein
VPRSFAHHTAGIDQRTVCTGLQRDAHAGRQACRGPAAHACVAGAVTEALKGFFGTDQIKFSFDSTVTNSTHDFDSTEALVGEIRGARIYGGMHFRNSLLRGNELGVNVAQQVLRNHFQAR